MAITRAQQARQLYQVGGGADAAKDDFKSPTSSPFSAGYSGAKSTVKKGTVSSNVDNEGDGSGIVIPGPVKDTINTINQLNYLKNLKNLNPQGIMLDIGKQILFDKLMSEADTGQDQNMMTAGLTEKQKQLLDQRKGMRDAVGDDFLLDTIKQEDDPDDPATLEDVQTYLGADGGRVAAMGGGIMDLEQTRQGYKLGKLVKKVTRGIKKIAKSPIGKAALLYTAGFGIPGTSFGGLLGTAKGSLFGAREGLFGTFGPKSALSKLGILKSVGDSAMAASRAGPLAGLFGSPLSMIGAASAIAGFLTPQQEEEAQRISDETGIDIQEIRNNPDKYLGRRFRAGGGLMRLGYQEGGDAEPVAKKTMPLIDMDGMEKDYRETGGFVEMGRMEKADDVPARLSKNEFVFTADAVRNAGEGDIDKGAEVMYNMMKNLEAGGEVSEESQGLEGARKMFQTSQRLEEVL